MRGYFGIGVYRPKCEDNVGTLWRSAYQLGAAFIFTIGRRYKPQSSDTLDTWKHIPLHNYGNWDSFMETVPTNAQVVLVETGGRELTAYQHPQRALYVLGAEDDGFPSDIISRHKTVLTIPHTRIASYNVAVAGSIVLYDRLVKSL